MAATGRRSWEVIALSSMSSSRRSSKHGLGGSGARAWEASPLRLLSTPIWLPLHYRVGFLQLRGKSKKLHRKWGRWEGEYVKIAVGSRMGSSDNVHLSTIIV
jgi:hypothetical protein